jgi:hypothetical protein
MAFRKPHRQMISDHKHSSAGPFHLAETAAAAIKDGIGLGDDFGPV